MGYKSKFKGSTVDDRINLIPSLIEKVRLITYQSLLDLREASKLKPGQFYRITDYVTTTSEENTRSAGHQFDVIVLAMTNDTLAERAWACHHDGDTYFQNSHLEAWQIWYCLDNDTSRFNWAVPYSGGGRGVIYRMIDEFNNDCPYDFKNIQFKHPTDLINYLDYYYTFSTVISGVVEDHSHNGSNCYGNKIGPLISNNKQQPNHIVFINSTRIANCYNNRFGDSCSYNSFGSSCYYNKFGEECVDNSFGDGCNSNSFGNGCKVNSFGTYCTANSFGTYCTDITFDNNCNYNNLGIFCASITFDKNCEHNSFGTSVEDISLGPNCYGNYIGSETIKVSMGGDSANNYIDSDCLNLTFVEECKKNTFRRGCKDIFVNGCNGNSVGNECSNLDLNGDSNSFENKCSGIIIYGHYNSFGNGCSDIEVNGYSNSFGNECSQIKIWGRHNSFGNKCSDIDFTATRDDGIRYNSFGNRCSDIYLFTGEYDSSWFSCYGNSFGDDVFRIAFSAIKNAMHTVSGIMVGAGSGEFSFKNESNEKYQKILILPGTVGNGTLTYDIDPGDSLDSTTIFGCRKQGVAASVFFEKLFQIQ